MKKYLFLFFLILISFFTGAQAPTNKLWDYRYGGDSLEQPFTIIQTFDHGFLLCGMSNSSISFDKTDSSRGQMDYWVVRTDSNGIKLWDKAYGGSVYDYLTCGVLLADSGFLLGGYSYSGISGDKTHANHNSFSNYPDIWIVRIDKNGNKIWDKTIGGNGIDLLSRIIYLSDGSFLLGGTTDSDSTGDMSHHNNGVIDYWIIKIDSNGNKIWDFNYGGSYSDYLTAISQTSDHGFILGGQSHSPAGGCKSQPSYNFSYDYWIVKVDSNGTQLWDKTLGGNSPEYLSDILLLPGDKIILGGISYSGAGFDKSVPNHGNGATDFWFIKTDSAGNKLWDKVYGGNAYEDELNSISLINNGILISGTSYSNLSGDKSENNLLSSESAWVIAIDSLGNKLWDKTLQTKTHVEACYGLQSNDGCYIFFSYADLDGGYVSQFRNSDLDYWLVKFCQNQLLPSANFFSSTNSLCQNTCLSFINNSQNANTYQWLFPGGTPSSDSSQNPQNICYSISGTFDVTLIATNNNGSDTLTIPNYVTVFPQVPFSPIQQNGDTLFSVPGYVSYQWYYDSTLISGANNYYYIAPQNGDYSVLITDSNGCTALAKKLNVIAAVQEIQSTNEEFSAHYSNGFLSVKVNSPSVNSVFIEVNDALGKIISSNRVILQKGVNLFSLNVESSLSGIYFIRLSDSKKILTRKIFIH